MPKPSRRLTRAAIIRALTRLGELCAAKNSRVEIAIGSMTEVDAIAGEFYGAPALDPGKRWLVEELLQEVRRG
jgi:hypothetical protein